MRSDVFNGVESTSYPKLDDRGRMPERLNSSAARKLLNECPILAIRNRDSAAVDLLGTEQDS
jgi:hypothetical protein